MRWMQVAVVVLILVGIAFAVAWRMRLFDRPVQSAMVADSAAIESQLRGGKAPRRRRDPPRIISSRFAAACLSPAPVLVYALDRTPKTYWVQLESEIRDKVQAANSLIIRHRLQSNGFEPRYGALYVWDATPALISALRCDTVVSVIEEVSWDDSEEIR
jgi:hypothetical protein